MEIKNFDVGDIKVSVLSDGFFVTDAGNLFGSGASNARIRGAMHAVLVATGDNLVLLDAGFGPELPETLVGRYELQRDGDSLLDSLSEAGHSTEDVTHVVLSHIDADHVGWALNPPHFPNATVHVQKDALEEARGLEDSHGRKEAIPKIEQGVEEGWCELLDGDAEIVEGVRVEVRTGHAAGHMIVWIESGDAAALFTADLGPSKIFLNPDTIAGVDTDPETSRQNRIEVLSEAESRNAPVILYHEPQDSVVRIRRSEKSGFEGIPYDG